MEASTSGIQSRYDWWAKPLRSYDLYKTVNVEQIIW